MIKKKDPERPSWDEYFTAIAEIVSSRSTCLRRKVGAVIVKDKRILSTGYNGAASGLVHCAERGCLRDELKIPPGKNQEICRGLHAEQNAIIQAALHGAQVKGAAIYTINKPCVTCAKMIVNAGIGRIYYIKEYEDKLADNILEEAKIEIIKVGIK